MADVMLSEARGGEQEQRQKEGALQQKSSEPKEGALQQKS